MFELLDQSFFFFSFEKLRSDGDTMHIDGVSVINFRQRNGSKGSNSTR